MKTPKPGQFCIINGTLYRGKRRQNGCNGCALNDIFRCPNVTDSRSTKKPFDCIINDIILIKV